jgi:hypothetical protein
MLPAKPQAEAIIRMRLAEVRIRSSRDEEVFDLGQCFSIGDKARRGVEVVDGE